MTAPAVDERRKLVIGAGIFFGVLVVLIALVAILAGGDGDATTTTTTTVACEPGDAACLAAQQDQERPGIIPRPGEGHAPTDAGEPGGAAQVALFFGIVVGLGVIVVLVVRSVRRNAGNRTPSA